MNLKLALRIVPILFLAVGILAVPHDAMAAIAEQAGAAVAWLDEIAIAGLIIVGCVILDMSSWSLMTNKRR